MALIAHCGTNTTLEDIYCGLSMVGILMNIDQTAMSARLSYVVAAELVMRKDSTQVYVRIEKIMTDPSYLNAAGSIRRKN